MLKKTASEQLFEEAKNYFPGGVSSPVRAFRSVIGPPLFMRKGEGPWIWDEDGNRYLDFCCSWGPLILGHNHAGIREAVIEAVHQGTSFGTPTHYEVMLGRTLLKNNRFIEKLRFVSSGTEAVMSAIRLARGATGRSKILKFEGCYHGHVDSLMVKAGSGLVTFGVSTSAGIPEEFARETLVLPLHEPEMLEQTLQAHAGQIACIIIEPVPANNGLLLQDAAFLRFLREACDRHGVLLIFDEVISGFRLGFEGAAGHYDIRPDIVTYGKIIGGGMPVGAYGASRSLMSLIAPDGPVYQAGTLSGNPVAMAAGYASCQALLQARFYENLEARTNQFVSRLRSHCDSRGYEISFPSIGSIFWIAFTRERIIRADQIDPASMEHFKKLHFELLERGIYLGPSGYEVGFVSAAHGEAELDWAATEMCAALDKVLGS